MLLRQYFTTAPYACEPASLPKYPPNKEMDAKFREESRRYAALCCNTEVMPCHCQEEQPPAISKRPDDGDHAAPCARTIASLGRARAYAPIKSGRQLLQTPTYVVQARLGLPPQQLLLAVDTSNDAPRGSPAPAAPRRPRRH